ncbi:MAG: 6-phosphofructokinase [Anaerolineae bacterium]|nr:6-phosphofructokinase [Anaerolineae bacterium]
MKRIAVLTSGGDAPGMNAAIRAVARAGNSRGVEVFGVRWGYEGLIEGNFRPLGPRDVGGIIQSGGTILGSARSLEFKTDEGRKLALDNLASAGIEGLVVIGGNGSQTGAYTLHQLGFPVVGVASTIDNDLVGSDMTIGVDTALNIALEAIDRLKVTASSHRRAFLVEVMGRDCGYLAVMSAIAGGAEMAIIPEVVTTPEDIAHTLTSSYERGKTNGIVVVAEGAAQNAGELLAALRPREKELGFEIRATTLGHIQRGGAPGAFDRILASRLGTMAAELLIDGTSGVLVGQKSSKLTTTPHEEVAGKTKPIDLALLRLAEILTG